MTAPAFATLETEFTVMSFCEQVGHLDLHRGYCRRCLAVPNPLVQHAEIAKGYK